MTWSKFIFGALTVLSLRAWAGPPFQTDDPEPIPIKHYELYFASQMSRTDEIENGNLLLIEFNYGAYEDVHLHMAAPLAFSHPKGETFSSGFGDLELGVKYRFIHETENTPQIGLFPIVEFASGNKENGLGAGNTQVFVPLWIQKSLGKWTSYGGGGWWYNPGEGNRNYWRMGWLLQRELSSQLTLGAEIVRNTQSSDSGTMLTTSNLGGQFNFNSNQYLLFSIGHSLDQNNISFFYLSLLFN